MQPGDLRRFRDGPFTLGDPAKRVEESTFVVLRTDAARPHCTVDILIDGGLEEGLGYFWVEDSSEVINEAG